MTEISFYHLLQQPLNMALPRLLEKVLQAGFKAVVRTGSSERMQDLDQALWKYDPDSFLPHGSAGHKYPAEQPVYITTGAENPNEATILVLTDGVEADDVEGFQRCLEMFDGNDSDMVAAARTRWKSYKEAGHELTYWQQTDTGGWTKKG